jgi:hypothetical protein
MFFPAKAKEIRWVQALKQTLRRCHRWANNCEFPMEQRVAVSHRENVRIRLGRALCTCEENNFISPLCNTLPHFLSNFLKFLVLEQN